MLEECVWDETSRLFQLRGFWDSGVKDQSPKSKILEELEHYWKGLAQQGRTLEEAVRWTLVLLLILALLQGSLFKWEVWEVSLWRKCWGSP